MKRMLVFGKTGLGYFQLKGPPIKLAYPEIGSKDKDPRSLITEIAHKRCKTNASADELTLWTHMGSSSLKVEV